jgi:hypothetical protein
MPQCSSRLARRRSFDTGDAFYRVALRLSAQTLSYVAGVIRRHRAGTVIRWCMLKAHLLI